MDAIFSGYFLKTNFRHARVLGKYRGQKIAYTRTSRPDKKNDMSSSTISPYAIPGVGREKRNLYQLKKLNQALDVICDRFKLTPGQIRSKSRYRAIVVPRQILCRLAHKIQGVPLKEIGLFLGGRDHTTVIHSCRTVQDLVDTNEEFREEVVELERKLTTKFLML